MSPLRLHSTISAKRSLSAMFSINASRFQAGLGLIACALLLTTAASAQTTARTAPAAAPAAPPVSGAPAPAAKPAVPPISAAPTAPADPEIRAQLSPRRYTTLAAEFGAKVNRLPVAEGATFRAGQLLVAFDCSIQQAQLQKVQAELEAAEKTLDANIKLEKLESVGQLELDLARAAVQRAKAEVNISNALVGKCNITAPYSGRLAEQKVREQQFVQAGQPLLDIIDDGVLELEFIVPSRWLAWIKKGSKLEVQIDETGKTYPARFTRIGARVDPVSQSVKVAAAISGRYPELIAGMSGTILATPPAGR